MADKRQALTEDELESVAGGNWGATALGDGTGTMWVYHREGTKKVNDTQKASYTDLDAVNKYIEEHSADYSEIDIFNQMVACGLLKIG